MLAPIRQLLVRNAERTPSIRHSRRNALSWDSIDDGARLAALGELGILDTAPEPEFDRFTTLAAELLGVPVSLVSLVDRDRQFFKSAHGLTDAWAAARETPLSHSFCRHPVATGKPLVITDARRDKRFTDNLAVRDLSVIAYAGMPLVLSDGYAVGALCAIDTEPHEWTERDLRILGDLAAAVATMFDLRRALNQQSLHDPLTGLPNRALTVAYSEQLSTIGDGDLLAVAIGIDGLGAINEDHGIAHGDRLISLVARRIARQLSSEDVLGRLQGDVFVVLRPRVADPLEALDLAHRIRAAVCAEPVSIRGDQLDVSATVGIATASVGTNGDALLGRALESLVRAKGRNGEVAVAEPGLADRAGLRGALPGAARRGEITVEFQPIVELATGRTESYEALARWRHPERGLIGPSVFIPEAEATGDIVLIGEHVLRTACTQLSLWRAIAPHDGLRVTVNFSPVQLAVANIAEVVAGILAETGLPGSALTLEITEGVFISAGAIQRRNLEALHELGIRIALDDFGTGYSALSYLKRFPVDVIKVDRCFLDGLETDHRDAALMRAILAMGAGMDLEVVAEGVETRAQRELLRLSGCTWGQGFLFAEPLPPEQIHIPGSESPMIAGAGAG
jgi:diguanylate cyclase (GGDEF)-like protein